MSVLFRLLLFYAVLCLCIANNSHVEASSFHALDFQIVDLEWEYVDQLLPKESTFTVLDIETGERFDVQRRAGSNHIDAQPLTVHDTNKMKKIFHGEWSWNRRAVFVEYEQVLIPASIHGMPHGGGALQNNFPGHTCIHFIGSTTHGSGKADLSHQLMIIKATGKLQAYIQSLQPKDTVKALLLSLKNRDHQVANHLALTQLTYQDIENIDALKWEIKSSSQNEEEASVNVSFKLYIKDIGPIERKVHFTLQRNKVLQQWVVDPSPILCTLSME
ncbi:hypothetical protein Q73_04305 [Bacillus coahuilensis m2-6]|nr:hypothetical protein Q73_04305 [Bacillus coahuilensis m2-6]